MSWVCTRSTASTSIICLEMQSLRLYGVEYDELCSLQPADAHMQCSSCVRCTQYDHHIYCLGSLAGGLLADWFVCYQDFGILPKYVNISAGLLGSIRSIVACRTIIGILLGFFSVCSVLRYGRDRRTQTSIQFSCLIFRYAKSLMLNRYFASI